MTDALDVSERREKILLEKTPEEREQERRRLAEEIFKASPVKLIVGKRILADTLAGLIIHRTILFEIESQGKLAAEESRTIPSVASSILRYCRELGIAELKEESLFGDD